MKITRKQLRRIIKEAVGLDYGSFEAEEDAVDALMNPDYGEDTEEDDDYYEQRIQDDREELYLEDLSILKGIVEKYGAVDMQRLMGDIKKTRYLDRYDFDAIEEMLIQLQRNDEIDYDEESGQWLAI